MPIGGEMPLEFFAIRAISPSDDARLLNSFTSCRRVLSIEKQFVDCGLQSYWSICVDYLDHQPGQEKSAQRRKGIDYREVLSDAEFALFSKLRDFRKQAANADGVPVYALFTNEQLAAMVQSGAKTIADLQKIPGVGESRLSKHADSLLKILTTEETADAPSESSVSSDS